jgi:CelD/BcsL family acetyltransferase involved in cellulose biosynthesis
MGDGEVCSENLDILSAGVIEKEVCRSVFSFLINKINNWDMLLLDDIASDSSLLLAGRTYANDHGLRSKSYQTTTNPFFKITQPWEAYFQALGKKTKKNFRWGMNQLNKLGETRFFRFPDGCHMPLEQALSEMMRLHEACWNDRGRPGVFQRKSFRQFHKMISQKFYETQRLALFFLFCGDMPIAAEYGFTYRNKFYSYQAGYDPAYKKFGIGKLMQILTLKYFIDKGYQEFDFLRGELAYKDKYADQKRHNVRLIMSRGTLAGDAAFIYIVQTKDLKKKIKILVPQTIWSKLRFYKENKSMRG